MSLVSSTESDRNWTHDCQLTQVHYTICYRGVVWANQCFIMIISYLKIFQTKIRRLLVFNLLPFVIYQVLYLFRKTNGFNVSFLINIKGALNWKCSILCCAKKFYLHQRHQIHHLLTTRNWLVGIWEYENWAITGKVS